MGVPGLWEAVSKAGVSRSLANLAVVDGFEGNKSGKRAYRVGIDASIWYHHATFSKGGENPELRLLFFRMKSLAKLPLLPLFIFDGRERPKVKRGSKMGKAGSHNLTDGLKKILDIFGMEWRMALGEAEAELAYLNRCGVIDAVMTDDVDTLVFGALTIIKNPGIRLSGNKSNPALNSAGKASPHHVMIFTAQAIKDHPDVRLTKGGLVLIALLAGGDYDKGVEKFGKDIGHALARCGFGEQLLAIYQRRTYEEIRPHLAHWRADVNQELHTNSRGFLRHKHHSLNLPADFPNMQVIENYVNPVCSGRVGRQGGGPMRGNGDLNLSKAAGFCEQKFGEWGYRSEIIKRFRDLLWEAAVIRVLRRAALEADEKEKEKRLNAGRHDWAIIGSLKPSRAEAVGTPASIVKKTLDTSDEDRRRLAFTNSGSNEPRSGGNDPNPLLMKIISSRQHVSTDLMHEYSVQVSPIQLVTMASSGLKGVRPEPAASASLADEFEDIMDDGSIKPKKGSKKPPPEPHSLQRMWLPASMIRHVHPGLVEEFEAAEEAKKTKKSRGKGKGKAKANESDSDASDSSPPIKAPPKPKTKHQPAKGPKATDDDQILPSGCLTRTSSSSSIIDPWFTSEQDLSDELPPSSDAMSAYFLCSENPDDPSAPNSEDEGPPVDVSDGDDGPLEEDLPRDKFDILFDQVMGISARASRPTKATISRRKRPRVSTTHDGVDATEDFNLTQARAIKRKKADVPDLPPTRPRPIARPVTKRPTVVDESGKSQSAHVVTSSTILHHAQPERRLYHARSSSSQSGGLFPDEDDIIDLT